MIVVIGAGRKLGGHAIKSLLEKVPVRQIAADTVPHRCKNNKEKQACI